MQYLSHFKLLFFMLLTVCLLGCSSNPSSTSKNPSLDEVIQQAAGKIEERLDKGTKVALINVQSPTTQFSDYVLTYLESILVNNGKLIVVDRANLDKIRQEQGFQLSGEVSEESAKAIGKMIGAGAIITGTLINIGDSYRLTLKAINVETATVAASYPADIAKSERVQALLASGNSTPASGTNIITIVNNTGSAINRIGLFPMGTKDYDSYLFTLDENINNNVSERYSLPPTDSTKKYNLIVLSTDGNAYLKENISIKSNFTVTFSQSDKIALSAKTSTTSSSYKIGDIGPAGGIIFYDKGNNVGGWRYLEAAPANTEKEVLGPPRWITVVGRRPGDGKENTNIFIKDFEQKGGGINTAPWLCNALNVNGFNDWYLPSADELLHIYNNLYSKGIGGFKSTNYWSSNYDNMGLIYVNFSNGEERGAYDYKSYKYRVRAIRQF